MPGQLPALAMALSQGRKEVRDPAGWKRVSGSLCAWIGLPRTRTLLVTLGPGRLASVDASPAPNARELTRSALEKH